MAEEKYVNKGIIFKNDKAKGNEPAYKGKGNFNGQDFEIGCWVKQDRNGKDYFSVKFSPPYVKPEQATNQPDLQEGDKDGQNLPF
jgi:uncharacterized protein (DUF736 family)